MANVIEGPNTFTISEWHSSNDAKLSRAELQRAHAKNIIAETRQVIKERQEQTDRGQRDVEQKLNQRIGGVKFWHSELNRQLISLNDETSQLEAYKQRLQSAVSGCIRPLNAAEECLEKREHRINIDLVYDAVQNELLTEVQVIKGVCAMLERGLEQVIEQIRLNRSAAYHLSVDLKDKETTLDVDSEALSRNNNNIEEMLSELCLKRQNSNIPSIKRFWTTPGDWQKYSEQGIARAEEEIQHSIRLRSAVDEILSAGTEDLRKQKNSSDNALRQRIEDVTLAKTHLETEKHHVSEHIGAVSKQIEDTIVAISNKNAPRYVAEERTHSRAQNRPKPIELCRDNVQYRLLDELDDINNSVKELNEKKNTLNSQLKSLRRAQLDLEEDIEVKKKSLDIDNSCVVVRSFDILSY